MLPAIDPVLSHTLAAALGLVLLSGAWAKLRIDVRNNLTRRQFNHQPII